MRAYIFHLREFIYPDDGPDKELLLSIFYATLHGYKIQGKKFAIDRPSGIHSITGEELYENDEVEIRYDLTRLEILTGMKPVIRGFVEYRDGSFVAANDEEDWLEYLGNDLIPENCKFFVKIVGNRHEKQP